MSAPATDKAAVHACLRQRAVSLSRDQRPTAARERALRDGVADCFESEGFSFARDVPSLFNALVTIDFLSPEGIAVLVRMYGDLEDVAVEARTVASDARVRALLLVTTRPVHRKLPGRVNDKPLDVCWLGGVT
jgi:hypothetical protein